MMKTVPVTQYLNGKLVASYASMRVAAELSGARANHISEVANGVRKTTGGFSWKRGAVRKGAIAAISKGTVVATFNNIEAVGNATNVRTSYVLEALSGKRKTVSGYNWQ